MFPPAPITVAPATLDFLADAAHVLRRLLLLFRR